MSRAQGLRVGATALVIVAMGGAFHRAFEIGDLVWAVGSGAVFAAAAAAIHASGRVPAALRSVGVIASLLVSLGISLRAVPSPTAIVDGVAAFLSVALPAPGLDGPRVVPTLVVFCFGTVALVAAWRGSPGVVAGSLASGTVAGAVLVGDIGMSAVVPLAVLAGIGALLALDVRADLAELPPLVGARTESRLTSAWWRPLPFGAVVVAVAVGVSVFAPRAEPWDPRAMVEADEVVVVDDNALATAVAWLEADDSNPAYRVDVAGVSPGRIRIAVLDGYVTTGWHQTAPFSLTGGLLAADPVTTAPTTGEPVRVEVEPLAAGSDFRTAPVAGRPVELDSPSSFRFAASSGQLLALDASAELSYSSAPMPTAMPAVRDTSALGAPASLRACEAGSVVDEIAGRLTEGLTDPVERLAAIENWIKVTRIYDPSGPGGQTIGAVEQFLSGPNRTSGNLEVYITSFALLARCADVPVRVVVGLPAPLDGVASTTYATSDVTAWIETPLTNSGWVPVDPIPSAAEMLQQAALSAQLDVPPPPPPPSSDDGVVEEPPVQVAPVSPDTGGLSWRVKLAIAVTAVVLMLLALWIFAAPAWVVRRRRRAAEPAATAMAAWTTVVDACVDRGHPVDGDCTPTDIGRLVGTVCPPAGRLVAHMAPVVDRVTYSGESIAPAEVDELWSVAEEAVRRLPSTWRSRSAPLRAPRTAWRRLRTARSIRTGDHRWGGSIPEALVLRSGRAPDDLPDLTIESVIGEGSTGVVYRARHAPTGRDVAVKVFTYGPSHLGFDAQRFEWEVRIAQYVSGKPNLPEVFGAGITPRSNMPYLVTTIYDRGTLLERVRRGGSLSSVEAVALGVDLATALTVLHDMGVVHADVKPENVFSSDHGWVLGDLGSAWLRASRGPAASLTPPYAAPEVWRGANPTPRADLFSLGLTMLFAVTGQVPIAGNAPTHDDIIAAFPDHPVLMRTLDPDPRRRPRSAAAFALELDPFAAERVNNAGGSQLPTPTLNVSRQR